MNYTNVLEGQSGFTAAGFAKSVLKSQIDFLLGIAVMRANNPARDVPQFDADVQDAMGDNGLPEPQALDVGELTMGSAAAFVLLSRHIKTPHPETGRKEEYLVRFLKDGKSVLQGTMDYSTNRAIAQAKATCEMLKADPTKRIESIQTEAKKKLETISGPVQASWISDLRSVVNLDDNQLIDLAEEALVNAGRDPAKEIKRAAVAFLDSQKKRLEHGDFVQVDAGVYALAQ